MRDRALLERLIMLAAHFYRLRGLAFGEAGNLERVCPRLKAAGQGLPDHTVHITLLTPRYQTRPS